MVSVKSITSNSLRSMAERSSPSKLAPMFRMCVALTTPSPVKARLIGEKAFTAFALSTFTTSGVSL